MPGKHAPASPRSFYVSVARALGAALGAVGLMVVAVLVLLSRDNDTKLGGPVVSSPPPSVSSRSPTPRPSVSATPSPRPAVLPATQVTVQVLNGTTRNGLARRVSKEITDEGYRVLNVGNASRLAKSTIFYREGSRDEALAFQTIFREFTVLQESTSTGGAMLRVVIGSDYP